MISLIGGIYYKKMIQMNSLTKQKQTQRQRHRKQSHGYQRGNGRREINQEFGINRYTLLTYKILGWPKGLFGVFHKMLTEKLGQIFGPTQQIKMAQQLSIHLPIQETQEMQVRSLGGEDALEEEIATHSSILIWKILWTEEPGRPQSVGSQRVRHK